MEIVPVGVTPTHGRRARHSNARARAARARNMREDARERVRLLAADVERATGEKPRDDVGWRRRSYVLVTLACTTVFACALALGGRGVGDVDAVRASGRAPREGASGGGGVKEAVFLTYADRFAAGACVAAETAARKRVYLQPLGRGEDARLDVRNVTENVKTRKLYAWRRAMTDEGTRTTLGIGDDTVVYLGDAFDVLYFQTYEEIVRRFREMEAARGADGLIVVSSERNCWPWMWNATTEIIAGGRELCATYPKAPSSYRYLNSGNLMGRAKNVVALLNDVIDRLTNPAEINRVTLDKAFVHQLNATMWHSSLSEDEIAADFQRKFEEDDQLVLAKAFLSQFADGTPSSAPRPKYKIALDYEQKLFHSAFQGGLEGDNVTQYKRNDTYYDASHLAAVNTETHTSPAIVHFNGGRTNFFSLGRHLIVNTQRDARYFEIKGALATRYPAFKEQCDEVIDHMMQDDWAAWLTQTLSRAPA